MPAIPVNDTAPALLGDGITISQAHIYNAGPDSVYICRADELPGAPATDADRAAYVVANGIAIAKDGRLAPLSGSYTLDTFACACEGSETASVRVLRVF